MRRFVDEEEIFQHLCDIVEKQTNITISEIVDDELWNRIIRGLRRVADEFTIILNNYINDELNELIELNKEKLLKIIKGVA